MNAIDFLFFAGLAAYPLLWLYERAFPAVPMKPVSLWDVAGILLLLGFTSIATYLPLLIPEHWLGYSLFSMAKEPIWLQVLTGQLAATFVQYLWHRSCHAIPFLWKGFHQIHHSPTRFDVSTSFVFHPSEAAAYTLMGITVSITLLGLDPLAASIVGFIGFFNAAFQHANIRTPSWLVLFVQRPEAHAVHHQFDVHAYNYSDLPLWDMLFGSYRANGNERRDVGFERDRSRQWISMLLFRDVHRGSN